MTGTPNLERIQGKVIKGYEMLNLKHEIGPTDSPPSGRVPVFETNSKLEFSNVRKESMFLTFGFW